MKKLMTCLVAVVLALAVGQIWSVRRLQKVSADATWLALNLTNYVAFSETRQASNEAATVAGTRMAIALGQLQVKKWAWQDYQLRVLKLSLQIQARSATITDFAETKALMRALPDDEDKKTQSDWLESAQALYFR